MASLRNSMAIIFALAGCACVLPRVENARILAIETIAGKSHWNFMSSVLRALTRNGHNVTVLTPFPEGDRENYTEIDTSAAFPMKLDMDLVEIRDLFSSKFTTLRVMVQMCRLSCNVLQENKWFKRVLALDRLQVDFDAIIIEPCMSSVGLMHPAVTRSSLPLIFTEPIPVNTNTARENTGHFHHPGIVSSMFAHYAHTKTFAQRFANTLELLYNTAVVAFEERLLKTFDPKPYDAYTAPVPTPSLVFTNNHFISDVPRPNGLNAVSVGGIHLRPPKKIPNDILEFIEDSPHGVVLFTFGSTVAISSIPKNIQIAFKEALAQLPQRVLLKYEGEMEDKPSNVMTKTWFPQRDILMHPNVRLFISHGGISGTYEAVDAGVPVLGFPLFGDQPRNIDGLVEAGMAISMEVLSVTTDTFLNNIVELINNKKYSRNAKIASDIFKDRPMTLEKSVVYWTEYVIRHKGAPHLKSHALNLTWYQYMLLDVIAVILISCFTILFVMDKIFNVIYKYIIRYLYIMKTKSE